MNRVPCSFTIKASGKEVLTALADDMDLSRSALIRLLLNEALKARGITAQTVTLRRVA